MFPIIDCHCHIYPEKIAEKAVQKLEDIIAVYSLEGVKQSELRRGVNIVKYGDGQVKKIYVK